MTNPSTTDLQDQGEIKSPRQPPIANGWAQLVLRSSLTGPIIGLLTVLIVFVVILSVRGDENSLHKFLSLRNLQLLVYNNTVLAALALGMLLIMISGGIDLSVGSVVALVTVVTMTVYSKRLHGGDSVAL